MLPLTIEMRDHLRQEKTGNLPSPLPAVERQLDFSIGTLGLWSSDHFFVYYRSGRVPQPGIILLGRATGDVAEPRACLREELPRRRRAHWQAQQERGSARSPSFRDGCGQSSG